MPFFLIRKPLNNLSKVSDEKGNRAIHPYTGKPEQPHKGIDLVPGTGEGSLDVFAAHDGTVIFSGQQIKRDEKGKPILDKDGKEILVGYGNHIVVQAEDGRRTRYAHLATKLVGVGQPIGTAPGMVKKIGIAGNTGGSTGVHLHFEVIASDGETRENPRQYLAEAFPDDFTTTVNAGSLEGEIVGDQRDNTMIANSRQNTLEGLAGRDTYRFPTLAGSDVIDDVDLNGKIVIGGVALSGKAHSKRDVTTNEIIPDQWTLGSFNLARVGDDLEIYQSGTSRDKADAARVVVKGYPFASLQPAFGINLDLKEIGLGYPKSLGSERLVYKVGNSVYSTKDDQGKFFVPAIVYDEAVQNPNYALRFYDSKGVLTSTKFLTDIIQTEISGPKTITRALSPTIPGALSCKLDDGSVAFIYGFNEYSFDGPNFLGNSYAFIAKVDANGELISNEMVHQITTTSSRDAFYRTGVHIPSFISPNGMCFNTPFANYICGTLDDEQLDFVESSAEFNYDGAPQDNSFAILPTGHKITATYQNGADPLGIAIASPIYAQTPDDQKIANYDVTGIHTTNPELKTSMLSLSREEGVNLKVSPNPNSCLAVIGCDSNPSAKMSFPVDHHSQISLYSSTDRDYTLDQLLNGEFDFSAATPLPISRPVNRRKLSAQEEARILADPSRYDKALVDAIWERGLGGKEAAEALVKESERSLALGNFTNSTDDDYSYGYYGEGSDDDSVSEPEIDLENLQSPYTIILLPNNQTVILVGVNATEVAKTPEVYFLTQNQLTNSPSGQPSGKPSKEPTGKPSNQPIAAPSGQPTGYPTSHPTAGDLIMPSGQPSEQPNGLPTGKPSSEPSQQPSLKPFANPSAVPSYKPQAIPSFNPTGKPSSLPTGEPSKRSKQPTNQPSRSRDTSDIPTAKPSFNPISNSPSASQTEFSTSYQPTNLRASFEPTSAPSNAGSISPTARNTIGSGDDSKPSNIIAPVAGGVAALLGILGIAAVYKYCKGAKANKTVHPKSEKDGIFVEIVGKDGDGNEGVGR
ncbi:MAG: peptidoglycan DD-metalloendopeptidase family protein [Rickettsiales bacterium]|nr:peptidoglycan DD-metalloendopeptidase family protein [Rickettsiales bacterium]